MQPRWSSRRRWLFTLLFVTTLAVWSGADAAAPAPRTPGAGVAPDVAERIAQLKDHCLHLEKGRFKGTDQQDLKRLFELYATDPNRSTLLVQFHGGLINEKDGLTTSERLLPKYWDAGAYPVFFIWKSGLDETISQNLAEISRKSLFQRVLLHIARFVDRKIPRKNERTRGPRKLQPAFKIQAELNQLRHGVEPFAALDPEALPEDAPLSESELRELRQALESDAAIKGEAAAIARELRAAEAFEFRSRGGKPLGQKGRGARSMGTPLGSGSLRPSHLSPEVLGEIRGGARRSGGLTRSSLLLIVTRGVGVFVQVVKRLQNRRHHDVFPTLVEEILRAFYVADAGRTVWNLMKESTKAAFGDDPTTYGGTAFLAELKSLAERDPRPRRILLIGHSAGAIYVCHFLKNADRLGLPKEVKFEIVFLAPACDFRLLEETLKEQRDRIAAFRMFGMQDTRESEDAIVPLLYPRSLLYFISGVLEKSADEPLVGMARYYSGRRPYDARAFPRIAAVLSDLETHWEAPLWAEIKGGPGRATDAKRHGDFDDNDDLTLKSLQEIIRDGFTRSEGP